MLSTIIFILSLYITIEMSIVGLFRLVRGHAISIYAIALWSLGILGVILKILGYY